MAEKLVLTGKLIDKHVENMTARISRYLSIYIFITTKIFVYIEVFNVHYTLMLSLS